LDWKQFVHKEGIADELKQHGKDGFIDRQQFLVKAKQAEAEALNKQRRKL
jgi:hypothetical protein